MQIKTTLESVKRFPDLATMERDMLSFGLRRPTQKELMLGIEVTESLLGQKIADQAVIERLQSRTRITAWVIGDPVDGLYIIVPLTSDGEVSVRNSTFDPANPLDIHVAAYGQSCSAVYVGVYAGASKASRRSIMAASAILPMKLFGPVSCFARAASKDGARSMSGLGFTPVLGGLPDLYVFEPTAPAETTAA